MCCSLYSSSIPSCLWLGSCIMTCQSRCNDYLYEHHLIDLRVVVAVLLKCCDTLQHYMDQTRNKLGYRNEQLPPLKPLRRIHFRILMFSKRFSFSNVHKIEKLFLNFFKNCVIDNYNI